MKKLTSLLLIVCILATCLSVTAFAADADLPVTPKIEHTMPVSHSIFSVQRLIRTDYDLSSSGSIDLNIENFRPDTPRVSIHNYITNSKKITVSMTSDISCSVKVYLYNASNDTEEGCETISVGTVFSKSATFRPLNSTEKYYFRFENLGQQTVHITGSISD